MLGLCYRVEGDGGYGIESAKLGLSSAREADTVEYQSRCLLLLGEISHDLGKSEDARHYYEEALALNFPKVNCCCAIKLGALCLEEGKVDEAQDYFARGIALCRELLDKTPRLYKVLYHLAFAQLGSGRTEEVLATYRKALELCSAKGVTAGGGVGGDDGVAAVKEESADEQKTTRNRCRAAGSISLLVGQLPD